MLLWVTQQVSPPVYTQSNSTSTTHCFQHKPHKPRSNSDADTTCAPGMGITAWNRKDKKNTLVYQTKRHTIILPPSALHLPNASAARDGGIRRGCASSPAHREPGGAGGVGAGSRRAALAAGAGQAERVPGCAGRCRGPDPLPREKGSVRGAFLLRVPAAMRWLFVPPQQRGRQQLTLVYEII